MHTPIEEPMLHFVAQLERRGYVVTAVTHALNSPVPVMQIVTPDGLHTMHVRELEYFADPSGCVASLRENLRGAGYVI